jgi:RNA polymerase sigma-70 factor (ECF subfamily)
MTAISIGWREVFCGMTTRQKTSHSRLIFRLTSISSIFGEANLRTWLTRIALNDALSRRHRQRSTVELGQLDTAQERRRSNILLSSLTTSTPEHAAARSQIRELLKRAIDDLPPTFRIVLIMRDVEEASIDETANVLGIMPETVRTRLHRARRFLRDRLGEQFAAVLKDVFPFERPRCDALVRKLLLEINSIRKPQDWAKG